MFSPHNAMLNNCLTVSSLLCINVKNVKDTWLIEVGYEVCQEVEIGKIIIQGLHWQNVHETLSQPISWAWWPALAIPATGRPESEDYSPSWPGHNHSPIQKITKKHKVIGGGSSCRITFAARVRSLVQIQHHQNQNRLCNT